MRECFAKSFQWRFIFDTKDIGICLAVVSEPIDSRDDALCTGRSDDLGFGLPLACGNLVLC